MNRSSNSRDRRLNFYSWAWFLVFGALGLGILFHGWIRTTSESRAIKEVNSVAYRKPSTTQVADTQPPPLYGLRNIEDVRVGDRVFALNPEISDEERAQRTEPDWSTWRRVHLEMEKPDGGILRIDMIRPRLWFTRNRVRPGSSVFLDLPEMGAQGAAKVISTSDCPPIQLGPGQVVTATFAHPPSTAVLDVHFEGESEPIGVTENHRFWSVDRDEFVESGEMPIGERVQTYHGDAKRIEQKLPRPGPSVVYNLEVYGEHVYFVGGQGLLAHNTYPNSGPGGTLGGWMRDGAPGLGRKAPRSHGTASQSGMVEISARAKSNKAFFSVFKDSSRAVEFVYDSKSRTIVVSQWRGGDNFLLSPHERLARALPKRHGRIVGGEVTIGKNGKILTNELSGHYGTNWTPNIQSQFMKDFQTLTGRRVKHTPFGNLPGGRN